MSLHSTYWGHGNDDPEVKRIIVALEDWFEALQSGTAESRLPDPFYTWRGKVPNDEDIETYIGWLDDYLESQRKSWGDGQGFTTSADYNRLKPLQRRALMQDLDQALG